MAALAHVDEGARPAVQVSYREILWWARYLDTFTASDLADAMGVHVSVGQRGVAALLWHGVCKDTGEALHGAYGAENVVHYIDPRTLPGPKDHDTPHTPPPWSLPPELASYRIYVERGQPVRIRSDRETRRKFAAGSGGARHHMLQQERRYQAMQEALERRKEASRERAKKEPKWKRKRSAATIAIARNER